MSENKTVVVVDVAARGDALAKAYLESEEVGLVVGAPGNQMMAHRAEEQYGKQVILEPHVDLSDPQAILEVAEDYDADLIDVAQDNAIAGGAGDLLREHGFTVFCPSQEAARLESSKIESRRRQQRWGVPGPHWAAFDRQNPLEYVAYLANRHPKARDRKYFVKADGLCYGKGVDSGDTAEEVLAVIHDQRQFGEAADRFLLEDAMEGEEFSYFVLSDGRFYRRLKSAQDYKRADEGDRGLNTGGMGGNAPTRQTAGLREKIETRQIEPVIRGQAEDLEDPFQGYLYLGGMVVDGQPMTVEYNVRMGDPEGQMLIPGIKVDYYNLMMNTIHENLAGCGFYQDDKSRCAIVIAADGYPGDTSDTAGHEIRGVNAAMDLPGVRVFGYKVEIHDGRFYVPQGAGRLLTVVGEDNQFEKAREKAIEAAEFIAGEQEHLRYRKDIGHRELARLKG